MWLLDDKGRAVNMDYDVDYTPAEFKHRFNIKADMQILNYGKATSIDQQQLKQAKSVAEASKGSMLENFIKGFSEKLGQSDVSEHPVGTHSDVQDLDANLAVLADKTYDATHAYDKTYKAVFIAKLTAENRHILSIIQFNNSKKLLRFMLTGSLMKIHIILKEKP